MPLFYGVRVDELPDRSPALLAALEQQPPERREKCRRDLVAVLRKTGLRKEAVDGCAPLPSGILEINEVAPHCATNVHASLHARSKYLPGCRLPQCADMSQSVQV